MDLNVMLWHWGREGAGVKFTLELAQHLASRAGLNPHVSLSRQSGRVPEAKRLGLPGFHVDTFRGAKGSLGGLLSAVSQVPGTMILGHRFADYVEHAGIDLVLCTMHTIWHAAALRPLRRTRARFAMILHDAAPHPGDDYPLRFFFLKRQVRHSDGLIVLSDHVARQARETHFYPASRIWRTEHGAFDYGVTQASARTVPRDRKIRILFFGRMVEYKGIGLLLEAFRLLEESGVPVELSIVGSGDLGRYQPAIAALGAVTVVNRWILDDEVAGFLGNADLLVLPYVEASQSGVIAAASVLGLPTVVTPVGGLCEQVVHGQSGLIADGTTAPDVARAVERLIGDADLYATCSAGALERARTALSWDRVAETVDSVCRQVVALPPAGRRPW